MRKPERLARLSDALVEAKHRLSTEEKVSIDLPFFDGAESLRLDLTREELEKIARPIVERTRAHCLRSLADAKLTPAREKLLLDTCNWLLGRDDLLTSDTPTWRYPRLEGLDARQKELWLWGAWLGWPVLFAFLGLVVLMARRVR